MTEYVEGQKVRVITEDDGKVYDFGYYADVPGHAVIYEEGERNMQDSYAVRLEDLEALPEPDLAPERIWIDKRGKCHDPKYYSWNAGDDVEYIRADAVEGRKEPS